MKTIFSQLHGIDAFIPNQVFICLGHQLTAVVDFDWFVGISATNKKLSFEIITQ